VRHGKKHTDSVEKNEPWYSELALNQHLTNLLDTASSKISLWELDSQQILYLSVLENKLTEKSLNTDKLLAQMQLEDRETEKQALDTAIHTDQNIFKIEYYLKDDLRKKQRYLSVGKILETNMDGKMTRAFGITINMSGKYKMVGEIKRRERYLSAVANAAQVLLPSELEVPYEAFLNAIGPASGASRVYIFLNYRDDKGKLRQNLIAEWCNYGIKSELGNPMLQNSRYDDIYPGWEEQLGKGGIIQGSISEFAEPLRRNLDIQEIKAILVLPIIIRGRFAGYIGFDNCLNERPWSQVEIDFLSTSASHLTQALKRQEIMVSLKKSEAKLRKLSFHLMTIQEKERKRIAEELHDELGQSLLVLNMQLNTINKRLHDNLLTERCEQAMQYVNQIIENVRRLSRDLRPLVLEELGLSTALQSLFTKFAENAKVKISTCLINVDNYFGDKERINIYRVFQEALTNIGKHSKAKNISIQIKKEARNIICSVEDDGLGFDLEAIKKQDYSSYGMGLSTMSERINMLGGQMEIYSKRGTGSKFIFTIPCHSREG
jgi:signal transduction histidine kinase